MVFIEASNTHGERFSKGGHLLEDSNGDLLPEKDRIKVVTEVVHFRPASPNGNVLRELVQLPEESWISVTSLSPEGS